MKIWVLVRIGDIEVAYDNEVDANAEANNLRMFENVEIVETELRQRDA